MRCKQPGFGLTLSFLFPFCMTAFLAAAQDLPVKHIDFKKIPKGVVAEDYFEDAIRWQDSMGANLVILTGTLENLEDGKSVNDLHASHYLLNKDSIVPSWKVHDGVINCTGSITATFIRDATHVTDLDSDGVAEVWLL